MNNALDSMAETVLRQAKRFAWELMPPEVDELGVGDDMGVIECICADASRYTLLVFAWTPISAAFAKQIVDEHNQELGPHKHKWIASCFCDLNSKFCACGTVSHKG